MAESLVQTRESAPQQLLPEPPGSKGFSLTRARPTLRPPGRLDHLRTAIFAAAARAAAGVLSQTVRIRTVGEANLPRWRRLGPGRLLFALWHGDFFPIFHCARHRDVCVVVSRSPDGEILARLLAASGYRTVRGSSTHGATRAVIDLARAVKSGSDAAVAIDGPRGPALRAKAGIVLLARMTGCPIIPLGVGMSRFKQFASWDRFRLPLPLSRAVVTGAAPIEVPRGASSRDIETKRRQLQESMLALRRDAQLMV